MNGLLLYTGGAVVRGFGSITHENRLILMMEWIAEAILLISTGVLVVSTTIRIGAAWPAEHTPGLHVWGRPAPEAPCACAGYPPPGAPTL